MGQLASAAAAQTLTVRDPSTAALPTSMSPPFTTNTTATNASGTSTARPSAPERYATPIGAINDEREHQERGGDDACAAANAAAGTNFLSGMIAPTLEVRSSGVSKFRQEHL